MALNFPSSPTNLQQYTDPNGIVWEYTTTKGVWNKKRSDSFKEFKGAKIELNSTKTLTATETAISWDASEFDTGTFFNVGTYPTRATININGYYRLNILITLGSQGNGASYTITIKKNGTTTLVSETAGPNQSVFYDETILFFDGDYIEVYASESGTIGTILTTSFFEITRIGLSIGSSASPANAFSGVRLELTSTEAATATPTGITWDTATYNVNADINGAVYWTTTDRTKVNISTTGYYRIKSFFETGTAGTANSYKIDVKKDGVTLESGSLGPNETLDLDEVYYFTSSSYLQVYLDNSGAVGTLTTDTYFQLVREGV